MSFNEISNILHYTSILICMGALIKNVIDDNISAGILFTLIAILNAILILA